MVNPKDIPNEMLKTNVVPGSRGHVGAVVDSGVEGRATEKDTIRTNSSAGNKKSAGHVGASNVNAG